MRYSLWSDPVWVFGMLSGFMWGATIVFVVHVLLGGHR